MGPKDVLFQPVGMSVRLVALWAGMSDSRGGTIFVDTVGTRQVDLQIVLGPFDCFPAH